MCSNFFPVPTGPALSKSIDEEISLMMLESAIKHCLLLECFLLGNKCSLRDLDDPKLRTKGLPRHDNFRSEIEKLLFQMLDCSEVDSCSSREHPLFVGGF